MYESAAHNGQHVALLRRCGRRRTIVSTCIQNVSGDIFGSLRCDCGDQLANSMKMIEEAGRGCLHETKAVESDSQQDSSL